MKWALLGAVVLLGCSGELTGGPVLEGSEPSGIPDAAPGDPDAGTEPEEDPPTEPPANCADVECGPHAVCNLETAMCICEPGYEGDPDLGCDPIVRPEDWIGSECTSSSDCDYPDSVCRDESEFMGGMCSQACTRYCPDAEGSPTTFCVEEPGRSSGMCVSQCDTAAFPGNGCRAGYSCVTMPRIGEPGTTRAVCVPAAWTTDMPCADSMNLAQDDECYLALIGYDDSTQTDLARQLLDGTASPADALDWLDANYLSSQTFIGETLGAHIHDNYTSGHNASAPMSGMIVHYTTGQREDGTIRYFVGSSPHASTHFVIGSQRNGLVVQVYNHGDRTWHAAEYNQTRFGLDFANAGWLRYIGGDLVDSYGRDYAMNLPAFGNDPVHVPDGIPGGPSRFASYDDWQPYTYYQLLSYVLVGRALNLVYGLDPADVRRHGDVHASRVDPGPHFPFTALLELLFTDQNVFEVDWLDDYKFDPAWIVIHPEAR